MTDLKESGVDSVLVRQVSGVDSVFVRQVEEGYVLSGGGPTVSESFLCRGGQPVVGDPRFPTLKISALQPGDG